MNNNSQIISAPVKSTVSSGMTAVFSAAKITVSESLIGNSRIVHSPVVQSKANQSPVTQPKSFQPDLPESEFLNLSFDQLNQVAVRASRSNQMQMQLEAKEALEVKSKENFLQMPFERLMRLPVRLATLGKNDKDKQIKDAEEVTSNPTSINFQSIPVFSTQALESVASYNTNVEDTSTKTTTDSSTTTTTTTTTTVPPVPQPTVIPIAPILLVPKFLVVANDIDTISILLKQADGSFGPQTSYFIGGNPFKVISADFNRDGLPDLAVSNTSANIVSILLATGVGTFGPVNNLAMATSVQDVATGDFNGDGILDIVAPNSSGSLISLFLGTGTGSFGAPTNFAGGGGPRALAVGDFNQDGFLDLVVINNSAPSVSLFLGTGTGSFVAPTFFPPGDLSQQGIVVGDFNNDNILDFAIPGSNNGVVSIFLGTGTGSFVGPNNFSANGTPTSIAAGDFNKDGNLDLVVTNSIESRVSVFLGTGSGTFGAPLSFAVGSLPNSVAVADFNGDGKLDLAVTNSGDNNVSILLGNGNGSFQSAFNYAVGIYPWSVAVGFVPAGVSGSPINLGLGNMNTNDLVRLTINNIPLGWMLNAGIDNLDGSWSIETSRPELLTITTDSEFIGARALVVDMSWTDLNGDIKSAHFIDNIEAYAPDSAIFALPNDNLTGSSRADIFVITKSNELVQDKIFNFDTKLDQIDLMNFETVDDFSDLIIQNDVYGNALIHLGNDNQSILLYGIDANEVTDNNFLFNITPHTINNEIIDIGAGAIMPFNGVFENNGTIQVDGILSIQGDLIGSGKIVLGSSGSLQIKGHITQEVIFENVIIPMIFEHMNFTCTDVTTISLETLLARPQILEY